MKGKDLIALIEAHHLEEYDFPICGEDGMFVDYISIEEAYRTYKVPISTIRNLIRNKKLNSLNVLNKELIKKTEADDILKDYVGVAKSGTEKWKERKRNGFSSKRAN